MHFNMQKILRHAYPQHRLLLHFAQNVYTFLKTQSNDKLYKYLYLICCGRKTDIIISLRLSLKQFTPWHLKHIFITIPSYQFNWIPDFPDRRTNKQKNSNNKILCFQLPPSKHIMHHHTTTLFIRFRK